MSILAWIVLGGFAGWFASLITGLDKRMGCILNIIAGVVGAAIGGALFTHFGSKGVTGFNWWSLLVAFVGATVMLLVVRILWLIFHKT